MANCRTRGKPDTDPIPSMRTIMPEIRTLQEPSEPALVVLVEVPAALGFAPVDAEPVSVLCQSIRLCVEKPIPFRIYMTQTAGFVHLEAEG